MHDVLATVHRTVCVQGCCLGVAVHHYSHLPAPCNNGAVLTAADYHSGYASHRRHWHPHRKWLGGRHYGLCLC